MRYAEKGHNAMPANLRDRSKINEQTVRDTYARQGAALAQYWPFFGRWAANSQYGYVLQWADSEQEAEQLAVAHYMPRMHLIEQ